MSYMPYMVQIMSKTLFTVSVLSSKEFCEIISELISTLDFLPSIYTEPDKKAGYVSVYFESKSKEYAYALSVLNPLSCLPFNVDFSIHFL